MRAPSRVRRQYQLREDIPEVVDAWNRHYGPLTSRLLVKRSLRIPRSMLDKLSGGHHASPKSR
ncbi:hypothetical protein BDV96DRAFT_591190 [Lophiotrema nucula]|uniref:Uncharacterized protein n=1 Tax=Lophiotrema nucula TaxID=690887 RepID=A0A6A5YHT2_9PLEO|nr:hypothetical protein BDV96DRAFT_591190 [Lophiotrema nucula]